MSGDTIYSGIDTFSTLSKDWSECAIRINSKNIDWHRKELNTVQFKGGTRHGFVKSMIAKALDDAGYHFLTEVEMANGREADIYVASTDMIIEVETGAGPADKERKLSHFGDYINEIFVIDPLEWPTDYNKVYERACQEFTYE